MDHQVVARSEAAALEYIVQDQQHRHYGNHRIDEIRPAVLSRDGVAQVRAPSENQVQDHAGCQAEGKMPSRIGPVGYESIDELGNTVNDTHQRQNDTEIGVGDAIFSPKGRHCE